MIHRDNHQAAALAGAVGTVVLGAAAMYAFDPQRGRRRRALARDKVRRFATDIGEFAGVAARDAAHRARGLRARAVRSFQNHPTADDLVVIERVRSRLGRVVSHPHAIQVGARDGRVVLSGTILASEVPSLLRAVRSVSGVREIDDHLAAHHDATSIPALQGDAQAPSRARARSAWSPSLRAAAIVGGVLLLVAGAVGAALWQDGY